DGSIGNLLVPGIVPGKKLVAHEAGYQTGLQLVQDQKSTIAVKLKKAFEYLAGTGTTLVSSELGQQTSNRAHVIHPSTKRESCIFTKGSRWHSTSRSAKHRTPK